MYTYIYIRTHKSKLEDYKALHFFCVSEGAKFLNRRELQPKFSKGSKGGMKVGGIFPIKSPYIRDPSSYLPSSHLLRPPINSARYSELWVGYPHLINLMLCFLFSACSGPYISQVLATGFGDILEGCGT